MARIARPWFRSERSEWCVTIKGKHHNLGPNPEDALPPKKRKGKWNVPDSIRDRFEDLKADLRRPVIRPSAEVETVASVFLKFLDWCSLNRTPRTYEWYQNHIQSFVDDLKARGRTTNMPVDHLKPFHVSEWVDHKPTWGPMHRRGAITSVQRAFSWAEKQGHILKSPVRHVEKPAPVRREQVLTAKDFSTLLTDVKDQAFRDVLEFCWETGARVQEVRVIEARDFKPERGRVEISPERAKGKKRWRLIYLTERAISIITWLAASSPDGPIFRSHHGRPWDAQNFNNRFCRLQGKLGVKYALTAIRHSFATRLLESGTDHITVSMLLGHVDATMLSKVYSHIGERNDFIRQELIRASGDGIGC